MSMTQTIITNLPFSETTAILRDQFGELRESGMFFAICSTEYDADGNVVHDFLDIISEATSLGYGYVNTIVYPTENVQKVAFSDNVRYVVWLCKDHARMSINKDAIREKHIWKDVEWGKRAKNYNPKGKDPGNVWIPTEDNGRAIITKHILLSDDQVIGRLLVLSDCGSDYRVYESDRHGTDIPEGGTISHEQLSGSMCSGQVYFRSSEDMGDIPDGSAGVVVTSPPYWNLKDYFKRGQIGQEEYSVYLKRMQEVWRECYRILSPHGSLWVNINIRVQAGKVIDIPRDFVKSCRALGFYYKGIFIWHKSSGIPTSGKNIVDRHEYVLVFSKSKDFHVDSKIQSAFSDYKNPAINGGAFWNINRKAGSVGKKYIHPAIYPNELVSRIVMMTTVKGELVVDPFLGSGTTLIAALQCGRSCVGYEYNELFEDLMRSRFERELPPDSRVKFTM